MTSDSPMESVPTDVQQVVATVMPIDLTELTHEELMTEGLQVYTSTCAACHQATGAGLPGAFPSLIGSPVIKGPVEQHINIVRNGKPGTAMQAFASSLSPRQMAAVITYERNAWGNNTGDTVQANDVNSHGQ